MLIYLLDLGSQLYEDTKDFIMKVPQAFLSEFKQYLEAMYEKGKIVQGDFEALAMAFFLRHSDMSF